MFHTIKAVLGLGPEVEAAPYKVLQKFDGYDLIEYPEQKWSSVKSSTPSTDGMFWKLFNYIEGKNSDNSKISMTVPVMMSHASSGTEMQFFIPEKFQQNPPSPNNDEVQIVNRPAMILYSKFLPGFPKFEEEARKFQEELEEDGITDADFSVFYTAGYDNPYKLMNRRNEIMFRKI